MRQGCGDDVWRWRIVTVEGARVTSMNWSEKGLKGSSPADIGELDGLRTLDLGDNEIGGHLPAEIGKLPSLITLRLQKNCIEGHLPPEIGNLTSLKEVRACEERSEALQFHGEERMMRAGVRGANIGFENSDVTNRTFCSVVNMQ